MPLRLSIEEEGKRRAVNLGGPELTIGRGGDNGVVINDPRSSRQHCRILRTPQGLLLEDMESRNGTLLNGAVVKKSFVKAGDEFRVGNVRFVLEDAPSGAEAPEGSPGGAQVRPSSRRVSDSTLVPSGGAGGGEVRADNGMLEEPEKGGVSGTTPREIVPPPMASPARKSAAPERARARTNGGPGSPPGELQLEGLEGAHAGERVAISKSPFVIGRAKECDLFLRDKRASGRHAQIVREGGAFHLEDLGSTNGTLLNRRPVKRGVLAPGAVIQIGSTTFRAVPPGGAPMPKALGDEFVDFDVEKFLAKDRSQHPLAVVALLVILGAVGYFSIDIALRLGARRSVDPPLASNLLASNWSFEDAAPPGPGGAAGPVPGWRMVDGDQGRITAIPEHAQVPGNRALRLVSTGDPDLCRASHESNIVLGNERRYRIEGFVFNEGAFAAGIAVEWLRASKEGSSEIERSFSETARQPGEALDVHQVVTAPPSASIARVCLFILGGSGSAVFDRVSISPASEGDAGTSPAVEGEAGEDATPAAGPRTFRAGEEGNPLLVKLEEDGTVSLSRERRSIVPSLWAGLDPERDPNAFGPRLSSPREAAGDSSAVLLAGELPDEKDRRWITVETTALRSGDDVALRWRAAGAAEGDSPVGLCLYLETREKSIAVPAPDADIEPHGEHGEKDRAKAADLPPGQPAPEPAAAGKAAGNRIKELVIGERAERVSLSFGAAVTLATRPHPIDPSRSILYAESGGPQLEVMVSHGSRHEGVLAREHARRAEEEFRAGQVGAAIGLLSRMKDLFPDMKAEATKAEERIAEWRKQGVEALDALQAELAVLRRTPSPVVKDLILRRAGLLKERFAGTAEGERAARVIAGVENLWNGLSSKRKEVELRTLFEKAEKHFSEGELALAELFFRWVAEADAEGEMGRRARSQLKTIDGRRARDVNILLQ